MIKKNNLLNFRNNFFIFFILFSILFRENQILKDFLFIIIICIFTDIGGYIFGKIFKGPKLTKISPNKTYAGVFGGFFFSLIAGLISFFIDENIYTSYN